MSLKIFVLSNKCQEPPFIRILIYNHTFFSKLGTDQSASYFLFFVLSFLFRKGFYFFPIFLKDI